MSNKFPSLNEQMDLISRGAVEIIPEEELVKKIEKSANENKKLIVKLGCDPTRPDLHLGHSVVLRKLAQFQSLGHQAVLIIGDFTALIGDPSGRNATRPPLTGDEIEINARSYVEQAGKILNLDTLQIRHNSEWLGKMNFEDVIKLASKYTVARMIERDDFTKRYNEKRPISLHEFLYPLAQAMDSVAIESDVELGGTDQKFNLLVGRDIQREYKMEPQCILTMPLLVGIDGVEKMSKSYDNYIGIDMNPKDMFGRTVKIPDELIYPYFELATDVPSGKLAEIKNRLGGGENPRDIKHELAKTIISMYHSDEEAEKAKKEFDRIFVNKGLPDNIPEKIMPKGDKISLIKLIVDANFAASNGEARRLIIQNGVSIDNKKITDFKYEIILENDFILKVGKLNYLKIIVE